MRAKFVDCARRAIDEAAIQGVMEYVERLETLKTSVIFARCWPGRNVSALHEDHGATNVASID